LFSLEDSTTYQWLLQLGIEQGALQVAQSMVLRLGAKRFGPAPAATEAAVRGLTDRERLERMVERTLDAAGWDELLATT
jgi:hypothetical protein